MATPPHTVSAIGTTSAQLSRHGRMLEWCSNGPTKTTGLWVASSSAGRIGEHVVQIGREGGGGGKVKKFAMPGGTGEDRAYIDLVLNHALFIT